MDVHVYHNYQDLPRKSSPGQNLFTPIFPPPCPKRQDSSQDPPLRVHFRYLSLPTRQQWGDILVPRQWNLKIIEKSSWVDLLRTVAIQLRGAVWAEQGDELTDGRYAGLRNRTETPRAALTLFIFTGLFLPNMLAIDFY